MLCFSFAAWSIFLLLATCSYKDNRQKQLLQLYVLVTDSTKIYIYITIRENPRELAVLEKSLTVPTGTGLIAKKKKDMQTC